MYKGISKRYFTSLYETVTENGVTKKLHYLTSATGLFAIFVGTANGGTMHYTLKDHQGSLAAVVRGNTVERLSYDPILGRMLSPDIVVPLRFTDPTGWLSGGDGHPFIPQMFWRK